MGREVIFWQSRSRSNSNGPTIGRVGTAEDDSSIQDEKWLPAFSRYGQSAQIDTTGTAQLMFFTGIIPQSWLDPREVDRPYIYRVRDVLAVTRDTGAVDPRAVFLMGSDFTSDANYPCSIGFHNNSGPTWFAYLSALDKSVLRNVNTGITTAVARELMFELDGSTHEARWYIDGVLVDSFTMGEDNTVPLNLSQWYGKIFHHIRGFAGGGLCTLALGLGEGLMIEVEEVS